MFIHRNTLDNDILDPRDAGVQNMPHTERVGETLILTARLLTEMHLTAIYRNDPDNNAPDWPALAVYAEIIAQLCRLNGGMPPEPVRYLPPHYPNEPDA